MGKGKSAAPAACAQQKGGHGRGQSEIYSDYFAFNMLNRVVNGQARDDAAAGAVDVQVDGLVGVLVVQVLLVDWLIMKECEGKELVSVCLSFVTNQARRSDVSQASKTASKTNLPTKRQ